MIHAISTDDVRIRELKELITPEHLTLELPCSPEASNVTRTARLTIHNVLNGTDDRLIVVIGPCSIHDPLAALEYAVLLAQQRKRFGAELEIVMRVYFEKPRTTVGWKGLINDPEMDETFNINAGLHAARSLLLGIAELGVPSGTEYLETIGPQYIADLVAWGAIGARTTESQVHRELASGLSCPVGFKNGTDGNIKIAVAAIGAASRPHHFLGVTKGGRSAIVSTTGNEDCHLILRGGRQPNYDAQSVDEVSRSLEKAGLPARLMIDASHANSRKQPENQIAICEDIADRIAHGERRIVGVMIESNLVGGRQDHVPGKPLVYGQSVTDACLGWDASVPILERLAEAVAARRVGERAQPPG